jgi:hypothetical protein
MDAGEVLAERQSPRGASSRDQEPVVGDSIATLERDPSTREVEATRAFAEMPLDVEVVDAVAPQGQSVLVPVSFQELLGKGRAVVREMGFFADRNDAPAVAFSAQRLDGAKAGERFAWRIVGALALILTGLVVASRAAPRSSDMAPGSAL